MVGTSTNNRTIPIISQKEREGGSQKQVRIVTIPIPNIKIPDRRCVRFQTSVLEGLIVIRYYLALRGAENGVTAMVTPFFCVQG